MPIPKDWRRTAVGIRSRLRDAGETADQLRGSLSERLKSSASATAEAYAAALTWTNNSDLSKWLTDHFSDKVPTEASRAMDSEFLQTYIGGNWHRIFDGGHTLSGSWNAISEALPDLDPLEQLGVWANEYWKDLITARGMPIVGFDDPNQLSEYWKHLDCVNVAQLAGGELCGVSIYCNWNDPAKLIASATAAECSGLVYANVVAPLVSLIALGRALFLLRQTEQLELEELLIPALKGLSRSGASILLISIVPGGFLLHLSSGIVISVASTYAWDKAGQNKDAIFAVIKQALASLHLPVEPAAAVIVTQTGAPAAEPLVLPVIAGSS